MNASLLFPALAALAATATAVYMCRVRPWQLTWGATDEEVARTLPADDLVPSGTFNATRPVTIAAAPEETWPWSLQVGVTRAGWYSYNLLDNLTPPSTRRIIPELQNLNVGDVVPMSPDGKRRIRVHAIDLPLSMTRSTPGTTSWVWFAEPQPHGTTRLISRIRSRSRWLSPSIAFSMLIELGDILMMRKMLLNLRDRGEAAAASSAIAA